MILLQYNRTILSILRNFYYPQNNASLLFYGSLSSYSMHLSTVLVLRKPHFRCTFYICKRVNLFRLEIFTAKKKKKER